MPIVLVFTWNPNPAADLVTGYKLLFGKQVGKYTLAINVGPTPSASLDIDTGAYRYAAVAAVNAHGESEPSSPIKLSDPKRPMKFEVCEP